jgi:uncharacterized protein (DUF58 family)
VRPARPLAPIPVAVVILATWWLVAHNSGAGWVQALGDLVFGALLVGIFGPSVFLARARLRVLSAPMDSIAGQPVEVHIHASTRLRVRPRDPPGDEVFIGPVGARRSDENRVRLLPVRRGVHEALTLEVATAAPFALQWWTRRVRVSLPSALYVAPRLGSPESLPVQPHEDDGESVDRAQRDSGHPRGARPYRSGDNRRQVHWLSTAHVGELMVREVERPSAEPVTVTVVLPPDPEEAERVAERALGTVMRLLEREAPVVLATVEPSGPVVAPVADRRGAGRRLARAVAHADSSINPAGVAVSL